MNVQYGCGKCAPDNWINFDVSPTLRLERIPLLGRFFIRKEWGAFPGNVRIGDIVKGLPGIETHSCDAVYCSHVLEHLSYADLGTALANTYKILKPGGLFRLVVPDMELFVTDYLANKEKGDAYACHRLVSSTLMGTPKRSATLKERVISLLGHSHHLWNYDYESMKLELEKAGFKDIRRAHFNDSANKDFLTVEDIGRFEYNLAIECVK